MNQLILFTLFLLVSCASSPTPSNGVTELAPCEYPGVADGYVHPYEQDEAEARCAEFKSDLRNYVMR